LKNNSADRVVPLGPEKADLYFEHMLRLDDEARRLRFFVDAPDFHLAIRSGAAVSDGRACLAYVEGGLIRGAAELLEGDEKAVAEAAFSVESGYRKNGIGSLLMAAIIEEARRRGVTRIEVACLPENIAMQRLATRFLADLRREGDNVLGVISRSRSSPATAVNI
jgi:GNAT superfamily N-acetyltransferase